MTHPTPSRVRVVRLWPSSKQDQLRIEYDPQPDGQFRGIWTTRQELPGLLRRLYPNLNDAEMEEITFQFMNLCIQPDCTARFLELKRELPVTTTPETPAPSTEIRDFEW